MVTQHIPIVVIGYLRVILHPFVHGSVGLTAQLEWTVPGISDVSVTIVLQETRRGQKRGGVYVNTVFFDVEPWNLL